VAAIAVAVLSVVGMAVWNHSSQQQPPARTCSDTPFFPPLNGKAYYQPPALFAPLLHEPFQRTSLYLPMTDGVELAIDYYLPSRSATAKQYPTFLHLTRYRRAEKRSWWATYLSLFGEPPGEYLPVRSLQYLQTMVGSGNYALVSVDVRGTGASFGSRPVDLIDREVQDYVEVAKWVQQQPWCNGKIGTGGISYDGLTGALAAARAPPGTIQAVAFMFTPVYLMDDLLFPGGIRNIGFLNWYQTFTQASERNQPVPDPNHQLPWSYKILSWLLFDGTMPVSQQDNTRDNKFAAAIADHKKNFDMIKGCKLVSAKDSIIHKEEDTGRVYTAADLGMTPDTMAKLVENNVSVYNFAGYFDSGSVRASARLHNYMLSKGGDSKLTIGPWTHGARAAWSPNTRDTVTKSGYPIAEDVKRYMDCKLQGQCTMTEPALHYFLSGDDEWKTGSGPWPPQDGSGGTLQERTISILDAPIKTQHGRILDPKENAELITVDIDNTATSGFHSRWNLVQHILKQPVTYSYRKEQLKKTLGFQMSPFVDDFRMVGSVRLSLTMQLNPEAKDAAIFAYLDDVDTEDGTVRYITEGTILASHQRQPDSGKPIGSWNAVERSFLQEHRIPLDASNNRTFAIDFCSNPLPMSFLQGAVFD